MKKYPKILILGENLYNPLVGGILQKNLFTDFPKENIYIAAIAPLDKIEEIKSNEFYYIGLDEFIKPFKYFLKNRGSSGVLDFKKLLEIDEIKAKETKYPQHDNYIRFIISKYVHKIGFENILHTRKPSDKFLKWFDSIKPDIIYTSLGSFILINFMYDLVKIRKVKYLIHIYDDYLPTMPKGIFKIYMKLVLSKKLKYLFENSTYLYSICSAMSNEYLHRYKKEFYPLHNPVDINSWGKYSKKDWIIKGDCFRVVYTGRIGTANINSIILLSKLIDKLIGKGYKIQFDIYSFLNRLLPDELVKFDVIKTLRGVNFKGYVEHNEIPKVLAEADLLFLPLDFDVRSFRYARLSMPTKVSEYLLSGTPILVYAPKESALYKYAVSEGWASIVGEENEELLKNEILKLYNDQSLRENIGRKAIEVAKRNHDAIRVREQFQNVLSQNSGKVISKINV